MALASHSGSSPISRPFRAICLHPFVIGVPHRIGALDSALAYILRHEGVWCATGSEIIEHYLAAGATF